MKTLRGSFTVAANVVIGDAIDLLQVEQVIPSAKAQLLYSIKKQMHEKADELTVDDIGFQTIHFPEPHEALPSNNGFGGQK